MFNNIVEKEKKNKKNGMMMRAIIWAVIWRWATVNKKLAFLLLVFPRLVVLEVSSNKEMGCRVSPFLWPLISIYKIK